MVKKISNSNSHTTRVKQLGFTLVEMMVVVTIIGVLAAAALPSLNEMIAEQRVRAAATDVISDLIFARTEAMKQQRRVVIERTGLTWKDGWRIYIDANANGDFNPPGDTIIKVSAPYSNKTKMKICVIPNADPINNFNDKIIFRGDGTVSNAPIGAETGLRVSDDMGTGIPTDSKSRNIPISPAGRASVEILVKGSGVVC